MSSSFKVLVNRKKKWAISTGKKVKQMLISKGYIYDESSPDYTIVVGGDGTLYYYLPYLSGKVLLIGSGSSFRAQLTRNNWKRRLMNYLNRKCVRLPVLKISKGKKTVAYSINDVVFHTRDHRVVKIECKTQHRKLKIKGDGVIISTPFGSTAYSYSAGGKALPISSKMLAITPICPCFRNVRPFSERTSFVRILSPKNADLIVDGRIIVRKAGGKFMITSSPSNICFISK
ncbi:MAG: hypothetical protein ACPL0A_02030 [Candidatus Micrarchaeia archaeon]